jgi:hypothetical protein
VFSTNKKNSADKSTLKPKKVRGDEGGGNGGYVRETE